MTELAISPALGWYIHVRSRTPAVIAPGLDAGSTCFASVLGRSLLRRSPGKAGKERRSRRFTRVLDAATIRCFNLSGRCPRLVGPECERFMHVPQAESIFRRCTCQFEASGELLDSTLGSKINAVGVRMLLRSLGDSRELVC